MRKHITIMLMCLAPITACNGWPFDTSPEPEGHPNNQPNNNPDSQVIATANLTANPLVNPQATPQANPVTESLSLPDQVKAAGFTWGAPVVMRIFKQERTLEVWLKNDTVYRLFRSYPICAFSGQLGPKLAEGDRQAPEGFYHVRQRSLNPNSSYHLSFNLGFPNAYDRSHNRTGSYLMVHGNCVSVGCYAMTDSKIEEIYALAEAALTHGQREFQVQAFPFHLTDTNLAVYRDHEWYDFWLNLQTGYHHFETHRRPPKVSVDNQRYQFE